MATGRALTWTQRWSEVGPQSQCSPIRVRADGPAERRRKRRCGRIRSIADGQGLTRRAVGRMNGTIRHPAPSSVSPRRREQSGPVDQHVTTSPEPRTGSTYQGGTARSALPFPMTRRLRSPSWRVSKRAVRPSRPWLLCFGPMPRRCSTSSTNPRTPSTPKTWSRSARRGGSTLQIPLLVPLPREN